RGRVIWKGDPLPQPGEVNSADDLGCAAVPRVLEDWVIDPKGRGVRWVFVWLEPEPASGKALPVHPDLREAKGQDVTVEMVGCRFVPHAVALREGQRFVVKNKDSCNHNFGGADELKGGGIVFPPPDPLVFAPLKARRLPLPMGCSIHGWMRG